MNAMMGHAFAPQPSSPSHAATAETLAFSRRSIEKSFLDMGQRLLDSSRLLRDITSAHEGMPAELQGEDFTGAVALLRTLQTEAGRISKRQDANGERVESMMTMARGLHDPIDSLSKAVRNLGLIAINARIIAAGMAESSGDFDSFALEMVDLGKNAASIVVEFSKSHRKLVDALTHAGSANETFRQKHADTLSAISTRLLEQLEVIEGHRQHALADVAQSGRVASQIAGRIGQAVSSLQIGDITRQRLEHVEDALTDLEKHAPTSATEALVLRIQALQLGETASDFSREVEAFTQALRSLSSDAREVLEDSRTQSDALLANGGTALAGLVADLGSMTQVLTDYEMMRTRIDALRQEVGTCVSDMQDRMEAIGTLEQAMRLLSINTSVRCSRFGEEGRALRVVAQEMRELAAFTVEAATTITDGLEHSKSTLDDTGEDDVETGSQSLSADAATAIEKLNAVVDRMRDRAATIARTGPAATRLLQEAATASEGYGRHAQGWERVLDDLETACAEVGEGEGEVDGDLLAGMRQRYTMVAERRIHDELCGEVETASEPAAAEASGETSLEDVFF